MLVAALVIPAIRGASNNSNQSSNGSSNNSNSWGNNSQTTTNSGYYDSNTGYYYHDPVGITFVLADGWEVIENANYHDEILEIQTDNSDITQVWIDRYPQYSFDEYFNTMDDPFGIYITAYRAKLDQILLSETVYINERPWLHAFAKLSSAEGNYIVEVYVTDMPNDNGVFFYAIISEVDAPEQAETPARDDAIEMLYTLEFTK